MECSVWLSYQEVNEHFKYAAGFSKLSHDTHIEDPSLIVGVYKWIYDDRDPKGPEWPRALGFDCDMHVAVSDKYDLFIYTR